MMQEQERPDPLYVPLGELKGSRQTEDFRPSWRGWIHTGVLPFVVAGGVLLIVFGEGWVAKTAGAIFFACSFLLFGNSAVYHLFNWKPLTKKILKRIDHANIFLLIAGSYTPITLLGLPADKGVILISLVWGIAVLGIGFRVFWISAPRWLYVPIYLGMGWVAVIYMQDLFEANLAMMVLVIVGGVLYSIGAVIYGLKKPNPFPKHFGFHEIFHALTVAAFFCHWSAALIIGLDPLAGSLGSVL
jgi:hemolysin III